MNWINPIFKDDPTMKPEDHVDIIGNLWLRTQFTRIIETVRCSCFDKLCLCRQWRGIDFIFQPWWNLNLVELEPNKEGEDWLNAVLQEYYGKEKFCSFLEFASHGRDLCAKQNTRMYLVNSTLDSGEHPTFFHLYDPKTKSHFVSIRGIVIFY